MLISTGCWISSSAAAQEKTKELAESTAGSHQLTLAISHTHLSEGVENGHRKWMVVPSWALNYTYWLSSHWGIGLHNDIIVENFTVQKMGESQEALERTKPVSIVASALYKFKKHHEIIGGLCGEFAKDENFFVTRLGYEYGWELPRNWELSSFLTWDLKWQGYNSWSIGLAVSKIFTKTKQAN
jgi:hypothetical protein